MKVAIFENEYYQVETAFKTVNLVYFNNSLLFQNFPSSQALDPIDKIKDYDVAIVDIDLSAKSKLDGYALIKRIRELSSNIPIIILTGSDKVKQTLKDKELPDYDVLIKPISYISIHDSFKKIIPKS